MGRPPLPTGERRSRRVFFRTTTPFYRILCEAAKRNGKTVCRYVNDALMNHLDNRSTNRGESVL
jgi:hypothetical protein